jgi:hypothetical protein
MKKHVKKLRHMAIWDLVAVVLSAGYALSEYGIAAFTMPRVYITAVIFWVFSAIWAFWVYPLMEVWRNGGSKAKRICSAIVSALYITTFAFGIRLGIGVKDSMLPRAGLVMGTLFVVFSAYYIWILPKTKP